jgi:Glycosyl hydrolase family 12
VQRVAGKKLFLTSVLALLALIGFVAAPAQAAAWSTSDRGGQWSNGGYTVYNNVWALSGYGPQTMWANSYGNWGVRSQQPNTSGVKSYPNSTKYIGKALSALHSVDSSFNVTVPSSGVYNTAYDIWDDNKQFETMLWMNKATASPMGTSQGNVTLGGHTWTVYRGANGNNAVFSFVRTSNTTSGTVDLLPILNWIKNDRGWFGDITLGDVQFGYEITSSPAGLNFTTNSFSVTSS